jgi:hypothetical protein
MTNYRNRTVSPRTKAAVAVAATVAVPVLAALALPAEAVLLAPLALAAPFISMGLLEAELAGDAHASA